MEHYKYTSGGRTLMVEFKCMRCGYTHIEPYSEQVKSTEGNLQSYQPPEGWRNDSVGFPMLCPTCNKLLADFMQNTSYLNPPQVLRNEYDMLVGNLNRIMVSDDPNEVLSNYKSAEWRLNNLMQGRLKLLEERKGNNDSEGKAETT